MVPSVFSPPHREHPPTKQNRRWHPPPNSMKIRFSLLSKFRSYTSILYYSSGLKFRSIFTHPIFFFNLNRFLFQVLVERKSYARVLTLNRPKQLNALSYYMVLFQNSYFFSFISCVAFLVLLFYFPFGGAKFDCRSVEFDFDMFLLLLI